MHRYEVQPELAPPIINRHPTPGTHHTSTSKPRGNFRKVRWTDYTSTVERVIVCIPMPSQQMTHARALQWHEQTQPQRAYHVVFTPSIPRALMLGVSSYVDNTKSLVTRR